MAEEAKTPKEVKLEIRADETVANGVYANFVIANHSETEFTMDFVFVQPGMPKAKVLSRVILNPAHVKRLNMMLDKQLQAYEKRFGPIRLAPVAQPKPTVKTGEDDSSGNLVN